jgi:predicted DCC family thiol-disulfide oxidoreductase YuxK
MLDPRVSDPIVLYDADCGFCKVVLAVLLRWDRGKRLTPASIQDDSGQRLLSDMERGERLRSWHVIDRTGAVRSGGAGIPAVFALLPGGAPIAAAAARFPRATSRAYDWVAAHRALLARALGPRSRGWAARVIAERSSPEPPG